MKAGTCPKKHEIQILLLTTVSDAEMVGKREKLKEIFIMYFLFLKLFIVYCHTLNIL